MKANKVKSHRIEKFQNNIISFINHDLITKHTSKVGY